MNPGVEQNIIKQAKRFGNPIPDFIANKPFLMPGLELYYEAFQELATCRRNGQIAWESIAYYATFYGFDEEQTEDLFYHIRAMDSALFEVSQNG